MESENKKSVLIVEDDQSIRELYATALIQAGIDVHMADNGELGLKMALEHHPSVILLDIDMPIMDGHKTAEKIRLDEWGKTASIIFLTNHSDASNVAHATMLKPDDYIVKANIPIKDVINKVRMAMHG